MAGYAHQNGQYQLVEKPDGYLYAKNPTWPLSWDITKI